MPEKGAIMIKTVGKSTTYVFDNETVLTFAQTIGHTTEAKNFLHTLNSYKGFCKLWFGFDKKGVE